MAYTTTPQDNETIANLPGDIRAVTALVNEHKEAASAAHAASAISYGTGTVDTALDAAAGHEANQNNPHGVTAAQAGAVALADAVTTATAGKVVKRDSNGKIVGDITGNAATATTAAACTGNAVTATTAGTVTAGGHSFTPSWDGTQIKIQVDSTADLPVHNAMLLQGMTPSQVVLNNSTTYNGSNQVGYYKQISGPSWVTSSTGSGSDASYREYVNTGIGAGTYSLQSVLQSLINLSHSHTTLQILTNCNCCSCGGE